MEVAVVVVVVKEQFLIRKKKNTDVKYFLEEAVSGGETAVEIDSAQERFEEISDHFLAARKALLQQRRVCAPPSETRRS
jgi:malate synthase